VCFTNPPNPPNPPNPVAREEEEHTINKKKRRGCPHPTSVSSGYGWDGEIKLSKIAFVHLCLNFLTYRSVAEFFRI
jgi:hypothetical protein